MPGFLPGTNAIPETPFEATVKDKMRYQSITMMKVRGKLIIKINHIPPTRDVTIVLMR